MTVQKPTSAGLAKAMRSKIGRWCWFVHPDTGQIIQGTYRRGRKVLQLKGMKAPKASGPDGSRTYMMDETAWKVPANVRIRFGQPPPQRPRVEGAFTSQGIEAAWIDYTNALERELSKRRKSRVVVIPNV